MPFAYIAQEIWRWIAETGINLALLVLLALLIPRAGRFANRMAEKQVHESGDTDEGKTRLAIAGVGINIAQIVAFFLLLVFFLQQIGFSLVGATLPATVVSAAIGFGAQSIIADFLAGFFILTEKQYGVGDFVTFEGNGVEVSGDVIQITMRSTHIRTIEQSTVSIPNSTARICINHSNYWSSALVVIPVPLLGSTSADEATARAERAARRALSDPEITKVVLGDLSVHPAVAVTPPVVVGMPWTMDVRFLVRVEPLSQWMVERAIRIAVLNEFWEEYGSAPTMAGTRLDRVVDHTMASDAYPPTEYMKPVHPGSGDSDETRLDTAAVGAKASNDEEDHIRPDAEEDPAADPLDDDTSGAPESRRAFGGVMRLSTGVLLAMFAVLLLARGLTLGATDANPDQSGVLAPPPRTTATSPTATEPAPQPTTQRPATTADSPTATRSPVETAPTETGEATPEPTQPAAPTEPTAPGG
uniref:mechanosensitive ion channel family protein n=1 Tax=Corynebacterium sp. UBA2622 TaxID=1946393 RepID=UPI0025B8651C